MAIVFESDTFATADGWEFDLTDSVIVCKCGMELEPDAFSCPECGSLNPFLEEGLI